MNDLDYLCHSLPLNTVLGLLLNQPDAFQDIRDIVDPSLLSHSQGICSLKKVKTLNSKLSVMFSSFLTVRLTPGQVLCYPFHTSPVPALQVT